ncbi:S-adenosyl-L-methionine-dependent methyltransferase [Tilletiaria anomala UBC 951]|uniref:S-adenosyl-L-methionine-dependent methyltransferase n=1 Tax=Tilletiaria anomala (strain ATCC 24038 / CBS 436.72 / UBC 951) TaxID=1037660 RepID=A0A066VW71_TILAU|nr:S-adenosyl-L-methionine-dependent methyltransferase [Tilletiaria anomala UBC 951]KDN45957.1 S-adenosyl-L-methionine-dependent methyltransferase [Tilletiaria anomala UBC 951]
MSKPVEALGLARQRIDQLHREDPAFVRGAGADPTEAAVRAQDELAYADAMEAWALKLLDLHRASDDPVSRELVRQEHLVRVAARCQHLERFKTPRSTYPDGKAGYFKWRRELYVKQADKAKEILQASGVPTEDADKVHKWVRKGELNVGRDDGDAGTQLLEDAAVLVFLEKEVAAFAKKHEEYSEEKWVDILRKTLRKTSKIGAAAAMQLPMAPDFRKLVDLSLVKAEDTKECEEVVLAPRQNSRPKTLQEAQEHLANGSSGTDAIFGTRLLQQQDSDNAVWEHNAWDHVEPPGDFLNEVQERLAAQERAKVPKAQAEMYHRDPASFWNSFYAAHQQNFFKNRKWLKSEFSELADVLHIDAGPKTVVEIGCGAGDTLLPLLHDNQNPGLSLYGFDYSTEAVRVVRESSIYQQPKCGRCVADVWDLSAQDAQDDSRPSLPPGVLPGTVDVVVMIFVLSALNPTEWLAAARNIVEMLKPGGKLLFRDYGRYDLPQLRFKDNRLLKENFYVRGDGTRVYFFDKSEIVRIFSAAPLKDGPSQSDVADQSEILFDTLQLVEDRRMLVNRKQKKRMYRVWLQAKLQRR